jgi:hypothetical protein
VSERGIRAVLVRRNRVAGVVAAIASVVSPIAFFASFQLHAGDFHALLVGLFAMYTAVATGAAWLGFVAPRRSEIDVGAKDHRIDAGGARSKKIRSGVATALIDGRYRVDLKSFPWPRTRLEVASAEDARAILAALGLDRRKGTTRFGARWASTPTIGQMLFVMTPIVILTPILASWLSWPVAALPILLPLAVWLLSRVDVIVGTDGVDARSLVRRRFAAHGEIEHVVRRPTGVTLVMRSGKAIALDTSRSRGQVGLHVPDPIYDAIVAAWSRSRGIANPANAGVAMLAKGTRSTHDWIEALRGIGNQRGTGYRVAQVDDADLFGVVGDAQAPTELRAAAAIALGANPEHAPKLRVAADDVADPVVRRVVLAATAEDAALELELDHALAEDRRRAKVG